MLKGNWNFEWQMGYQYAEPVALPKGSKLQLITHFDNSPANRFNPDPAKKIVWGPQNWDEMSNCFIGVLFPTATAPEKVFLRSGPSLLPRGESGPTLAAFAQVDPNAVGKASQRGERRRLRSLKPKPQAFGLTLSYQRPIVLPSASNFAPTKRPPADPSFIGLKRTVTASPALNVVARQP